jgi:hypothetical protein
MSGALITNVDAEARADSEELLARGFTAIPPGEPSGRQRRTEHNGSSDARADRDRLAALPVDVAPAGTGRPSVFFVGIPDRDIAAALSFARMSLAGLRVGASPGTVRDTAQSRGLEVSELVDNVIYASAPARRRFPLMPAKWLLQFRFHGGERLVDVVLRRGIAGP